MVVTVDADAVTVLETVEVEVEAVTVLVTVEAGSVTVVVVVEAEGINVLVTVNHHWRNGWSPCDIIDEGRVYILSGSCCTQNGADYG